MLDSVGGYRSPYPIAPRPPLPPVRAGGPEAPAAPAAVQPLEMPPVLLELGDLLGKKLGELWDWLRSALGKVIAPGVNLQVPRLSQFEDGQQNACGTTSLAMVLNYLGVPDSRRTIDASIRRSDTATAPTRMASYARGRGLAAETYNNGSFEEIRGYLDRKLPPILMIDPNGPEDLLLHYIVVKGYTKNEDGTYTYLVNDPSRAAEDARLSESELAARWGNLRTAHIPTGLNHYFMVAAPHGTELPPRRAAGLAEDLIDVSTSLTNGVGALSQGDILSGILMGAQVVTGVGAIASGDVVQGFLRLAPVAQGAAGWIGGQLPR